MVIIWNQQALNVLPPLPLLCNRIVDLHFFADLYPDPLFFKMWIWIRIRILILLKLIKMVIIHYNYIEDPDPDQDLQPYYVIKCTITIPSIVTASFPQVSSPVAGYLNTSPAPPLIRNVKAKEANKSLKLQ